MHSLLIMNSKILRPAAVWSIDPFETNLVPSQSDLDALKDYRIFPVAVLPTQSKLDFERLNSYLSSFGLKNLEHPTILTIGPSGRTPVEHVVSFAREHHASVIALTSHGRSGLEKMFLGSFAERLLDHSPVPVLFLTTGDVNEPASHRAIFTTDFSPKSKIIFKKFLDFAKHSVGEVVLYHAEQLPIQLLSAYALAGVPIVMSGSTLEDERPLDENIANHWIREFSTPDLKIRLYPILRHDFSSISMDVLEICKKEHISLIGVIAERGSLEQTLFGSVAKGLFRKQAQPVWVYNARAE